TPDLMRESVKMAQEYDVLLHTHLAETLDEEQFCLETFGRRPVEYMQDLGWMGDHVWHAHSVFVNDEEVKLFAETDTGVAHCPNSNMRLGSGVAPILAYRAHGVRVGLGVDGSASNDGGHMLGEARQAMLLQRVQHGPEVFSARPALAMAGTGPARRGRGGCSSACSAGRRCSAPVRPLRWRHWAARACCAVTTSARWRRACRRT